MFFFLQPLPITLVLEILLLKSWLFSTFVVDVARYCHYIFHILGVNLLVCSIFADISGNLFNNKVINNE